jgi:hypothetical protein
VRIHLSLAVLAKYVVDLSDREYPPERLAGQDALVGLVEVAQVPGREVRAAERYEIAAQAIGRDPLRQDFANGPGLGHALLSPAGEGVHVDPVLARSCSTGGSRGDIGTVPELSVAV